MATELTVVLFIPDDEWPPTQEDIEYAFDCEVVSYEEVEV